MDKESQVNTAAQPSNRESGIDYPRVIPVINRLLPTSWTKVLLLLCLVLAGIWIVICSTLYMFLKHARGYESVCFSDIIILPLRIDDHRKKMGTFHIEKGMKLMNGEHGDASAGFRLLRLGLARNPTHLEGRKLCAITFANFSPKKALHLLRDGLFTYGGIKDAEYIDLTVDLMKQLQKEKELLQLSDRIMNDPGTSDTIRQKITTEVITLRILQGKFDQAEHLIERNGLLQTTDGFVFLAKIEKAKGKVPNQIYYLKQALKADKEKKSRPEIVNEICSAYLKIGKAEDALKYAFLIGHHLIFAIIHHYNGDYEAEEKQIMCMIEAYGDEPQARLELAAYAVETGDPQLATYAYELAAINGEPLETYITSLIKAKLQANEFSGALGYIESILNQNPDWLKSKEPLLQGLRALCAYGLYRPDLGDIYISKFISAYSDRPALMVYFAQEMSRLGEKSKALQLLETALQFTENHPELLALTIDFSIEDGSSKHLEERLRRLLELRNPSKEFAERALNAVKKNTYYTSHSTDRTKLIDELQAVVENPLR